MRMTCLFHEILPFCLRMGWREIRRIGTNAVQNAMLIGWLLASTVGQAQISDEGKARSRMKKGKWNQAQQALQKGFRKDSLNTEIHYLYAEFYFSKENPRFNIDSAYRFSLSAIRAYTLAPPRQKERMKRIPLDSMVLLGQRQQIDSAAFERAKSISTEKSYQDFIDRFAFASQINAAIELRDEEAFLDALKVNTYSAFQTYVSKYPDSHRAKEAHNRYEKLLFEDKTRDGKLKHFELFLQNYPSSKYRTEAEQQIFEISTAGGDPESFKEFLQKYPDSGFKKKSLDILHHILKESGIKEFFAVENDSLQQALALEQGYWVAIMKNGKFGFMDQQGREVIAPQYHSVDEEYICGDIRTDFLITSEGVIARNGKNIFEGKPESVINLGFGFLKVTDSVCAHIVHKSGFRFVVPCLENARLVANRFVAVQVTGKWGLVAFNGRELLSPQFDDITSIQNIIIFNKGGRKSVKTHEQVATLADRNPFTETMVFDDVKELDPGRYLVWNGALTGLLNSHLEFIVPFDRHTITKTPYGYKTEKNGKFTVTGVSQDIGQQTFNKVTFYENWLQLEDDQGKKLLNLTSKKIAQAGYDSLWFSNHAAWMLKSDSLIVMLRSGTMHGFSAQTNIQFIKGPDSVAHFYSVEKNKKTVYELMTGQKLFQIEFDEIEFLGHQVFQISRGGKRGLVGMDGKTILPAEYTIILATQKNYASLFKDKKFGLYDLKNRKLIKAAFERNVIPFQEDVFVAFKDGYYGFIGADSKPFGKFEFDEVQVWSDSVALVKKNFLWHVYGIFTGKIFLDKIRDYKAVLNSRNEKIYIYHRENAYGVVSTSQGILIPATFSDIVNVGSDDEPLYFTEKNVEEAGIYVVIYYDHASKLIRRQVFEKEEYDKIYCQDR